MNRENPYLKASYYCWYYIFHLIKVLELELQFEMEIAALYSEITSDYISHTHSVKNIFWCIMKSNKTNPSKLLKNFLSQRTLKMKRHFELLMILDLGNQVLDFCFILCIIHKRIFLMLFLLHLHIWSILPVTFENRSCPDTKHLISLTFPEISSFLEGFDLLADPYRALLTLQ